MEPSRSLSRRVGPVRLCVLFVALAAGRATAADLDTDRDAFTPSTHVIEPGSLLHEASYVFIDNPTGLPTNNYPEWLLRVGGTEWLEWRFGVNYGIGSQGTIVTSVEVGEETPDGSRLYDTSILYGVKVQVSRQAGWLPESAFILEGSTPAFGDSFGTVPVATGVAGWELAGGWRLDTGLRYAYFEGLHGWFSRWTPSAVLRMPVTERWEVHAEWFGSYSAGLTPPRSQPFFSPGTHVLVGRTMEIGLRVGWGLGGAAAPFFVSVPRSTLDAVPEGVVYLRTDLPRRVKPYVGQSMSWDRYLVRQVEHGNDFPESVFLFKELGRADAGTPLHVLEESWIRQLGGPTNKSNPGGLLSNKRYQMNDVRYRAANGTIDKP